MLDTSAVIAYLGSERTTPVAAAILDERVRAGGNPAAISAVSLAELLVRPFRARGERAAAVADAILLFPNLRLLDVTPPVAIEAARIRAATGIRMPDALILATAAAHRIGVVVSNDDAWQRTIARGSVPVRLVQLEALASRA